MNKVAYISGALSAAPNLAVVRDLYSQFAAACTHSGWEGYLPHQNTDPERSSELSATSVAMRDVAEIVRCDAMVIYVGIPSLGVGAEIMLGMHLGKPMLIMCEHTSEFSRFVRGIVDAYSKARIVPYSSLEDAQGQISNWLVTTRNMSDNQPLNGLEQVTRNLLATD
ncbi:MAG: nucleoside 2-deoxyribosyltransferase [Chloroflexi bacterium]|nr:nucleoside 2-deoxyribosyltransferase [Chloroflexota bacterium]